MQLKKRMVIRAGDKMKIIRTVKTQLAFLLRQKTAQAVFFLLLGMVCFNYIGNVTEFRGRDVYHMFHPMKLLTLSYNHISYKGEITRLFIQLYPLLIACPAGLALAKERQTRVDMLLEARIGRCGYKLSKCAAVFLANAIVFSLPFLLEILLNVIAFPTEATRDVSNWGVYDEKYIQMAQNYWFPEFFATAPYLYAVVMTLAFGAVSGLLGMLVMSFSAVFPVRYRVMYLILPFVLLNSTVYILPKYTDGGLRYAWYKYLMLFGDEEKNTVVFLLILGVLAAASVFMAAFSSKRDSLQ